MNWFIRQRAPVLVLLDLIAFQTAFCLTYVFRFSSGLFADSIPFEMGNFLRMSAILTTFWLIIFIFRGMYLNRPSTSRYEAFLEVFKSVIIGVVLIFIFSLEPPHGKTSARIVLIAYGIQLIFFSSLGRILYRNVIRYCFRRHIGLYRSILIGFGLRGQKLYKTLNENPEFGYDIVAIIPASEDEIVTESVTIGKLNELEKIIENYSINPIEYVLISLEPDNRDFILNIIDRVTRYPVKVMIIPDFYQILVGLARSQQLYGVPLLEVFPSLLSPFARILKRSVDLVSSFLVLLIGSPLLLLIGIAIKLDSTGPVLYRQRRIGFRGREFTLFKFRTMVHDAERETGAVWAEANDPRVTRVGQLLRLMRLDEIPQFWNVMIGDMSIVGPRPERKVFVDHFSKTIPFYARRLNVKPGITGWAQIRRGYDNDLTDVKEKLQYDLFYLENISISLDIKILAHTLWVMFTAKGR